MNDDTKDKRERFEKWHKSSYGDLPSVSNTSAAYNANEMANIAWAAWQAALAPAQAQRTESAANAAPRKMQHLADALADCPSFAHGTPAASAEDAPCPVSVEACEECMDIIGRLTAANAALHEANATLTTMGRKACDIADALQAKVEAAELDAKRYRWLQKHFRIFSLDMGGNHSYCLTRWPNEARGPTLSAAIDAAMGADK